MSSSADNTEFFVVGGPVQAERPCYVVRSADNQLLRYLDMGEFCTVFMPRQSGKTSLIGRCAKRLRTDGRLAAVVDLTQMGTLEYRDEPSRWFYTVAYRIVRDLRLKVDLQEWWRDRAGLSNLDRMSEFFWEIVLGNTTAPIAVFFDDVETVVGLPCGPDFLAAIRSCYERRASEPDYQRLSFVLAGVTHPSQFVMDPAQAPFEICYPVLLEDFPVGTIREWAQRMDPDPERARRALERVHQWTCGQPYLTQKLCRAVARHGLDSEVEDAVDRLVETLFLQANIFDSEPHLNAIRLRLSQQDDRRNSLLTLFGRIRKGARLTFDPGVRAHVELVLTGIVRINEHDELELRNPLYGAVFTARWVNQMLPMNWRGFARAGAVIAVVLFLPYWYTQILPAPFIRTLSGAGAALEQAESAFHSLRRIPGYRDSALRLYEGYLLEKGSQVRELQQLEWVEHQLEHGLQRPELAQRLAGAFWDGQAKQAEAMEDRDAALMLRLRALEHDSSQSRRRLDALVDADYRQLVATIRPQGRLDQAVLSPDGSTLVTLESGNQVRRWDTSRGIARAERPLELLAQEFVPLGRHLVVEQEGPTRDMELSITLNHFRADDLVAILTSPSGRSATLPLASAGDAREVDYIFNTATYAFGSKAHQALRAMAGEQRNGTWTLSLEDREEGVTGTLVGWGLRFSQRPEVEARDQPEAPVQIPDPRTTGEVKVVLGPAGRLAAATSAFAEARGYIFTWDLLGQEELARIPEPSGASLISFADQGEALVLASMEQAGVSVWDARSGGQRFAVQLEGRLAVPPVFSADGRHMVVTAQRQDQGSQFEVWDLRAGKRLHRLKFDADVTHVALAPGGRRMAASFRDNLVRVWDLPSGRVLAELFHATPVTALLFEAGGQWVFLSSRDRRVRAWNLARPDSRSPAPDILRGSWDAGSLSSGQQAGHVLVQARPGTFELLELQGGHPTVTVMRHGGSGALAQGVDGAAGKTGGALFSGFALETGLVFTAERGGFARIWRIPPARQEGESAPGLALPTPGVAAISPDGALLAWGNQNGEIMFRSLAAETAARSARVPGEHGAAVNLLRFSSNSAWMVSGAADGSLKMWDVANLAPRKVSFRNDLGPVRDAVPGNDGSRLATAGDYGIRLWNARTGETGFELPLASTSPVLALRNDGSQLLVPGGESQAHVRDIGSGELLVTLPMDTGLSAAGFSADDRFLVLADRGGQIRLYRTADYTALGAAVQLGGAVLNIGFVPGGNAIVARTHNWLHLLSMTTSGLYVRGSRLLDMQMSSGIPFYPDRSGNQVVYPGIGADGVARAESFYFDASDRRALLGTASQMLAFWGERLGLQFTEQGQLVTVHQARVLAERAREEGAEPASAE